MVSHDVTCVHRRKGPRKKAAPASALSVMEIATRIKRRDSKLVALENDLEADGRVKAWFAKNTRPPGILLGASDRDDRTECRP
jgi:hypothetical protein